MGLDSNGIEHGIDLKISRGAANVAGVLSEHWPNIHPPLSRLARLCHYPDTKKGREIISGFISELESVGYLNVDRSSGENNHYTFSIPYLLSIVNHPPKKGVLPPPKKGGTTTPQKGGSKKILNKDKKKEEEYSRASSRDLIQDQNLKEEEKTPNREEERTVVTGVKKVRRKKVQGETEESIRLEGAFEQFLKRKNGDEWIIAPWAEKEHAQAKRVLGMYEYNHVLFALDLCFKEWEETVKRSRGKILLHNPTIGWLLGAREQYFPRVKDEWTWYEQRKVNSKSERVIGW